MSGQRLALLQGPQQPLQNAGWLTSMFKHRGNPGYTPNRCGVDATKIGITAELQKGAWGQPPKKGSGANRQEVKQEVNIDLDEARAYGPRVKRVHWEARQDRR